MTVTRFASKELLFPRTVAEQEELCREFVETFDAELVEGVEERSPLGSVTGASGDSYRDSPAPSASPAVDQPELWA